MKLAGLIGKGFSALRDAERPSEPLVWLDPFYAPRSSFEVRVAGALARGPVALTTLVERLSVDDAVHAAADGVWSLDVGAAALPALRGEVARRLRALDGGEIAITRPQPSRAPLDGARTIVGYRLPGGPLTRRGPSYAVAYALD